MRASSGWCTIVTTRTRTSSFFRCLASGNAPDYPCSEALDAVRANLASGVKKDPRLTCNLVEVVIAVILEEDRDVRGSRLGNRIVCPANRGTVRPPVRNVRIVIDHLCAKRDEVARDRGARRLALVSDIRLIGHTKQQHG